MRAQSLLSSRRATSLVAFSTMSQAGAAQARPKKPTERTRRILEVCKSASSGTEQAHALSYCVPENRGILISLSFPLRKRIKNFTLFQLLCLPSRFCMVPDHSYLQSKAAGLVLIRLGHSYDLRVIFCYTCWIGTRGRQRTRPVGHTPTLTTQSMLCNVQPLNGGNAIRHISWKTHNVKLPRPYLREHTIRNELQPHYFAQLTNSIASVSNYGWSRS